MRNNRGYYRCWTGLTVMDLLASYGPTASYVRLSITVQYRVV